MNATTDPLYFRAMGDQHSVRRIVGAEISQCLCGTAHQFSRPCTSGDTSLSAWVAGAPGRRSSGRPGVFHSSRLSSAMRACSSRTAVVTEWLTQRLEREIADATLIVKLADSNPTSGD